MAARANGQDITEEQITSYIERYRQYVGADDDADWATYLDEASLTATDVRENAIRHFAETIAVADEAEALGVSVADEDIDAAVASAREDAGYADDDQGWSDYLSQMGYTADDYRADMKTTMTEDALVESQVGYDEPSEDELSATANLSPDAYTGKQVHEVSYSSSDAAQSALAHLDGATHEEFAAYGTQQVEDGVAASIEDRGWTCLDGDATQTYLDAVAGVKVGEAACFTDEDGTVRLIYVYGQYAAEGDGTLRIADMPEDIKRALVSEATYSARSQAASDYLNALIDEALEDVAEMPEGLSYDVDMSLSTYGKDDGTVSDEEAAASARAQVDSIGESASAPGSGEGAE